PSHSASAAISIRRVARLSRNVDQPDHILANPINSHKAERRPGSGEIFLAVTKHDGVQVDSILIDQAKFGEGLRQGRASNFDLPVALGLQLADRALKIILNKPGVGADRLQRARDDPFRLVPPRRREGVFLCIPFRVIVVPVTHDLIHLATVHTARLPLSLLDEVAEERGAWRKRHMVDVAVQGLVHSEHELSHTTPFPRFLAAHDSLRRYHSVDEFPSVRSIEPSYLNTLLTARLKVVQIDTVLAAWPGDTWLPMRGTSADLATHIAQSLVAPDVLGRILRVSFYPNRSELVVRPKSAKAPADRTIAPGRLLRR